MKNLEAKRLMGEEIIKTARRILIDKNNIESDKSDFWDKCSLCEDLFSVSNPYCSEEDDQCGFCTLMEQTAIYEAVSDDTVGEKH